MKKLSEDPKSMSQGRGRKDECIWENARLLPRELTASLAIRVELTAILDMVCLFWLAQTTINPAWQSKCTTIIVRGVWAMRL